MMILMLPSFIQYSIYNTFKLLLRYVTSSHYTNCRDLVSGK